MAFFSRRSKSPVGPTQSRIPWVPGFAVVDRLGREVNHSPSCSKDVPNEWSRTSPPIRLHGVDRKNVIFTLSLLTPYSRILLEKVTGLELVKKFPSFYET
jgi:hypothetical protein